MRRRPFGPPETPAGKPAPSRARAPRALRAWAAVYVGAWLVGLMVAPPSPDAFAAPETVARFFEEHQGSTMLQSGLVHGLAGVALAGWICTAHHAVLRRDSRLRQVAVVAGLAASAVSLVQVAVRVRLGLELDVGAGAVDSAYDLINRLDTLKLFSLGAMVAGVTAAGGHLSNRRWWIVSRPLMVLLPLSGLAFVFRSGVLTGLLYLSLPLLLLWVGIVTAQRASEACPDAALGEQPAYR